MAKNKINFKVGEKELAIVRPTNKTVQSAKLAYNKSWTELMRNGAMTNAELRNHVRKANIWDDDKEKERNDIIKSIVENTKIVTGLVKDTSLSKAKEAALQIRKDRVRLVNLTTELTELESMTAESQAENDRFNFLLVQCLVDANTKKRIFASVDEYLESDDEELLAEVNKQFANFYYGYDEQSEKNLPENTFLLNQKMCNDKLHLIKVVDGVERLVDSKGRLVNEEGRFVNEAGEFVDSEGNRVDAEGNPIVEKFPFLAD